MADVAEKGYSGDGSEQLVFQRPTGLKGVYYHPLTQVESLGCHFVRLWLICSQQVSMLGLVCFMCPGLLIHYTIQMNWR